MNKKTLIKQIFMRKGVLILALFLGLSASGSSAAHDLTFAGSSGAPDSATFTLPQARTDLPEALVGPLAGPIRGVARDLWADVIIGQPDFGQITPNQVTKARLFNPGGVLVDRSVSPNRLYVYDGGNSRVLGLSHLGFCEAGPNAGGPCTTDSDCPGSVCPIQEGIGADLVLGQPAFSSSACNGDGNFQNNPERAPASVTTLCSMPEDQISPLEGGSFANMDVDSAGNLYVPDWDNHRVLRYNAPFETDTRADDVWGQADFAGNACNRGREVGQPDNQSLCLRSPLNHGFVGGVDIDPEGNLWVADNQNNRVLRFPANLVTGSPGHVADLVLGQPDFNSWGAGEGLDQMWAPAAVRVDSDGTVYVADSQQGNGNHDQGRVLIFEPPLSSGMAASGTLNYDFRQPTGLELDPNGGIWVSDRLNDQLLLFVDGAVQKVLFKDVPDPSGMCGGSYTGDGPQFYYEGNNAYFDSFNVCDSAGSIGIDSDGNIFAAGSAFVQDVWRFPAPIPTPSPGIAHSADARIFKPHQFATHNDIGLAGIYSARGVAVAADQLIVADRRRLLFWNTPANLTSGQAADGYVGAPSPSVQFAPDFGRIRADQAPHLWTLRGDEIQVYSLPLTTGDTPMLTLTSPLPVLGGGDLSWDGSLAIGGIAPVGQGEKVWVADPRRHRVFRVRDPLTDPVVDIVLGQTSLSGTECNQGQGVDSPSQDSLCHPGAVVLDPQRNLWVSDHALEVEGNRRLLEFDADLFPDSPASALFGIPATRVYGTGGSFTGPSCQDALCGPWEPAFSAEGHMVVGLNAYIGARFPLVYKDPLTSPQPDTSLQDYYSMAYAATFDAENNLYVADLNRNRILIYWNPFLISTPTIQAVNPSPPACVLRNSNNPDERLLELLGENFSTTEHNLQFRRTDTDEESSHFHNEVNWESATRITVDISLIEDLLWDDTKLTLQARLTTYTNGTYVPVSDWSPEFILADDAVTCQCPVEVALGLGEPSTLTDREDKREDFSSHGPESTIQSSENDLVALYRQLRDQVLLANEVGQGYVEDFNKYGPELSAILLADADLRTRTAQFLDHAAAAFGSLLPNATEAVRLTQALYDEADDLVQDLANAGSPEFRDKMLQTWADMALEEHISETTTEIWEKMQQRAIYLPLVVKDN